jgi:signal transduction histidine kinase
MGMSVLVHGRDYSRLTLAKSLPWLGVFAIIQAAYQWGDIFIPPLLKIMGFEYEIILVALQLVILAISYAILYQFGVELHRPFAKGWHFAPVIPLVFFLIWLIGPFTIGFSLISDFREWNAFVNVFSRYWICLPATLTAVLGLIKQQRLQVKPMKLPRIDNMFRVAAGSLSAYGVLSGLVVPKAEFYPANVLNIESFTRFVVFPPSIFRALAGITLLYAFYRILEIFDIETSHMIRSMEEAQVIANERERIARDLHDGALQQVYATGLLAQSLKKRVGRDHQIEVNRLIITINLAIQQLQSFLRKQTPSKNSIDLAGALSAIIEQYRPHIQIDTFLETANLPSLTLDQTRNVTALVNEAFSNVIRHANSERMEVHLKVSNRHLLINIRDFGKGILTPSEPGYGLKNMRERARLLNSKLTFESEAGKGTKVTLDIPLEDEIEQD